MPDIGYLSDISDMYRIPRMSGQKRTKESIVYIQDENQKIRGEMDIPGEWDETYLTSQSGTLVLILPQIGAFVTYQDKSYVILSTETYQEDCGEPAPFLPKYAIVTFCVLLRITDEGDDAGDPTIRVKAGDLELI